jgi:hypothetical protein
LFTKHLLAGLDGGARGEDEFIRIFDLFEYVQPRVTAAQPMQHPIFKADLEDNFPVALRLGGVKAAADQQAEPDGFLYDAYVSYVEREPDASFVWEKLVPPLRNAGLRVVVSGDAEQPGVARVVSIERGIRQSKRTIVALSSAYLEDHMADFQNVLADSMGIQEGTYRLLPVKIEELGAARVSTRLGQLVTLDLVHPSRAPREFERLIAALRAPLPAR